MDNRSKPAGRSLPDAAHAAAAEARRRKRENPISKSVVAVFVVRVPPTNKLFGWEIRRFGSIVLERSVDQFDTAAEARAAGEVAMARI